MFHIKMINEQWLPKYMEIYVLGVAAFCWSIWGARNKASLVVLTKKNNYTSYRNNLWQVSALMNSRL
jgi:hypothetical protein